MKTQLFTIALAFISVNTLAQITVTDSDIISVGDIVYQAVDSLPSNSITIGNSGANQTWDFSSLQDMEVDIIEVISPVGTPYENIHPDANMCVEIDDELMYLDKSSTGLEMVGYGDIPLNMLMIPLPLVYGLSQQSGPHTIMDSVFANMFLPDSLAPFISLNPAYDQVDSLKINVVITSEFNVDAWGNVTIPLGTFDALRLKVEETTTTDFYAYCSSSLGLGGGWYSVPAQLFPSETEITNRYQWWSNDPLVKFMIAELEMDSLSNNVEFVTFLTTPQANSASNLESVKVNVYPNPTSKDLMIITDLINCSYSLTDVKGSKLLRNEFNNSTIIDLSSYSSGTYLLQIYTEEGNVTTKRVVVE
jgi:hypothetical protein